MNEKTEKALGTSVLFGTHSSHPELISWRNVLRILLFLFCLCVFFSFGILGALVGMLNSNVSSGYAMISHCDRTLESWDHTPPPKRLRSIHSREEALRVPSVFWYLLAVPFFCGFVLILLADGSLLYIKGRNTGMLFCLIAPLLFGGGVCTVRLIALKRDLREKTVHFVQNFDAAVQRAQKEGTDRSVLAATLKQSLAEFRYCYETPSSGFRSMQNTIDALKCAAKEK